MRIIDETSYKEGEKRIEDTRGYRLCTQCIHCPLTFPTQIYTDGYFWCSHRRKWLKGNDIVQFRCKGFCVKKCATCRRFLFCTDRSDGERGSFFFCNRWRNVKYDEKCRRYMGRRRVGKNSNPNALNAEEEYFRMYKEMMENERRDEYDNQGDREQEAGEYQEDQEADERMGFVSLPYSTEEDPVHIDTQKEA